MKIEIDISDELSQKIIQEGIATFPKEELHDIIREFIIKTLEQDEVAKSLLYTRERVNTYSNEIEIVPGKLTLEAAKKIDVSPALKEIEDKMIQDLKDNHRELLENVMLDLILSAINQGPYKLANSLDGAITNVINYLKMNNNLK